MDIRSKIGHKRLLEKNEERKVKTYQLLKKKNVLSSLINSKLMFLWNLAVHCHTGLGWKRDSFLHMMLCFCMMLCFVFVINVVLTTQGHFSCHPALLTEIQGFSASHTTPPASGLGVYKKLPFANQGDVQHHTMSYSAIKVGEE